MKPFMNHTNVNSDSKQMATTAVACSAIAHM